MWEYERESWVEEGGVDLEDLQDNSPPELVNPAPRLMWDVEALEKLTSPKEPTETEYRVWAALTALYLVGDASGQGFGLGLWDGKGLWYEATNWADHCWNVPLNVLNRLNWMLGYRTKSCYI